MRRPELFQTLPANWPDLSHGQRLVAKRKLAGLHQRELAAAAGLSVDRLGALERDRGKVAPAEIEPLLRAYNLSPAQWLLGHRRELALAGTDLPMETRRRLALLEAAELRALERLVYALTEGRDIAPQG